eukprot:GFYU01023646.1.p1 GENE.GFYU01023646.1~~GFYU01023646.1.p1  ORF type:complete len:615 (-),score=178.97 GFYU01023646.1:120-1964(-)
MNRLSYPITASLALVFISLVGYVHATKVSPIEDDIKVPVSIYVLPSDEKSNNFESMFASVLNEIGQIVDLKIDYLVRPSGGQFFSKNGPEEVERELYRICVQQMYPDNFKFYEFNLCLNSFYDVSAKEAAQKCIAQTKLDYVNTLRCATGKEGHQLLTDSARRTAEHGVDWSPTIYINGKLYCTWDGGSKSCAAPAPDIFVHAICNEYTGFKLACPMNCRHKTGNTRPIADAGKNVQTSLSTVMLDGTHSHDPDGDELLYHWQVYKSSMDGYQLIDQYSGKPILVTGAQGNFHIRLVVFDKCEFGVDTVRVSIGPVHDDDDDEAAGDGDGDGAGDDSADGDHGSDGGGGTGGDGGPDSDELGDDEDDAVSDSGLETDPCCRKHASSNCGKKDVEMCVCHWDKFCCSPYGRWDDWCVHTAKNCGFCSEKPFPKKKNGGLPSDIIEANGHKVQATVLSFSNAISLDTWNCLDSNIDSVSKQCALSRQQGEAHVDHCFNDIRQYCSNTLSAPGTTTPLTARTAPTGGRTTGQTQAGNGHHDVAHVVYYGLGCVAVTLALMALAVSTKMRVWDRRHSRGAATSTRALLPAGTESSNGGAVGDVEDGVTASGSTLYSQL